MKGDGSCDDQGGLSEKAQNTVDEGAPWVRKKWSHVLAQRTLGLGCYLFLVVPYLREVEGLDDLPEDGHFLYLSNHVSLLDTLLLGGIFWSRKRYPILVLGDRAVWQRSWIRRLLSAKLGFLIERGKPTKARLAELETFGRSCADFDLVVFPEGTRGDGRQVRRCQPGVFFVAQAARVPIVPIFIHNLQLVSTKEGGFHPFQGFKKLRVRFGQPIAPEAYLDLDREQFAATVRKKIQDLAPD
ncbi:MAG: 1-acyl-sn-glycerol-3-phosphate acyltransferase [Deltaproteobacteria bacterium]|nr:1-acyl-sn-glycerol-3-phosphate acyltransferase [Deltaproteobacteria bacterium]